jgi:hypothetical protein
MFLHNEEAIAAYSSHLGIGIALGIEKRVDRVCENSQLRSIAQRQTIEDMSHIGFDRPFSEAQLSRNFTVCTALTNQPQDIAFPRR